MKERGLSGVRLIVSDKNLGLVKSIPEFFPEAKWQRCIVHFYRNVFTKISRTSFREVSSMLKAIQAQENKEEALKKAEAASIKLKDMKFHKASEIVSEGISETTNYMNFPSEHWTRLRTNNPLERIMKEIRRRTRVIGSFPDENSAFMLVTARLRYIAHTKWGNKKVS
ncbi:transposase, mutator-like family protein [Leptospira santarosai str. JET]|nr:transposase, mutator-like family protein [Leptospira santarosai str. JET]EMO84938.1 transposase, mutator-like family protein [Leptospira santarosai str. AIM]EPG82436.1 transposase, mutator-like family protein [Leptospira santarosai serovar Shermani str. 1342KT]